MKLSSNIISIVIIVLILASNFQLCWSSSDNIRYSRQRLLDINNALSHPCPCATIPADLDPHRLIHSAATTTTTIKTRKRGGRRAGVRSKVRARKYRPFVPPVIFGNCRSIHNKIDELRANCRFLYNFRESCCIALTETWLHETIPNSAVELPNFTTVRSDRNGELTKQREVV